MKTVRDLLQDADPLRHEPDRLEKERGRLRQVVAVAASGATSPSAVRFPTPLALVICIALIIVGVVVVGFQNWSQGSATLQAAIRFEVRLAEDHPAPGLTEAPMEGSDRIVYLHDEILVSNDDIVQSSVIQGDAPSRFGVAVQFNTAGARKMRQATANHIGRPVAILIDGDVVAAPVVRTAISTSAVISGDFTQAEAERIVNGIGIR